MLRSENDPFLYLFADEEDIYFSKHLLKEDIYKKIYYKAKEKEYELVLYFFRLNNNETKISCLTHQEALLYSDHTNKSLKNDSLFTKLFSLSNPECEYSEKDGYYVFNQKNSTIQSVIERLIQCTEDRFMFVFPINTFVGIYGNEESRNSFAKLIEDNRYDKGSQFIFLGRNINPNSLPALPIQMDNRKVIWESLQEEMKTIWEPFELRQLERMMERISLMYSYEYLSNLQNNQNHDYAVALYKSLLDTDSDRPSIENMRFKNKKELYEYYSKKENYLSLIHRL